LGYCTKCGEKTKEDFRFCRKCGSPIAPSTESEEQSNIQENEDNFILDQSSQYESLSEQNIQDQTTIESKFRTESKDEAYYDHYSYAIDRRTMFDDGLLVLTSKDLILYSSDERDELKRIPLSYIVDCSYSHLRHSLIVKKRVNVEENFGTFVDERRTKYNQLQNKFVYLDNLLKNTRTRSTRQDIKSKIADVSYECEQISYEINQLENDPTKIQYMQKKVADVQKEQFKLPKDFSGKHEPKDEYKIWVYAIKRRLIGIPHLKVVSEPNDSVLIINGRSVSTTPLTVELPLMDEPILQGKYHIQVLNEGYEINEFKISTNPEKNHNFVINLKKSSKPNTAFDDRVTHLREIVPDRSLDLSYYAVEREVEGLNEILLLTRDTFLVMTKDKQKCLYEIPYGAINKSEYDKRFLRGRKSVKISYNERFFKNQELEFWLDDQNGSISQAELKQRSESLAELLNKKRIEPALIDTPRPIRSKNFFIIQPSDLENNFERFEPFEFERLIGKLFEKKGYKVEVTQERADLGVDVIARAGHDVIAIQVKHWQASVGGPDVNKTIGSMVTIGANRAMVITSSDFTNQAYEIQKRGAPVDLWNGAKLREEFRKYLLGAIEESRSAENS